jgi:putative tryptophan/tyrosine transport system substrate-binding protein
MRRRDFITFVGGAAAWPLKATAQQSDRMRSIGLLASEPLPPVQRFSRKLQEHGYIEGRNVRVETRFAEGLDERYPLLAAELVALPVDLIVTWGTPAAVAAKGATSTTPIVMGAIGDPVSVGLVSNLARPEGNITGFATQNVELEGKRLELLRDLLPNVSRVGVLGNASNPFLAVLWGKLRPMAERLNVALELFEVRNSSEITDALLRLERARPDGVLVSPDTLLLTKRSEICASLNRSRLPAVYPFREYAPAGGLIVHAADVGVLFERSVSYVDRILKGTKPGDLPVQLATEFELIINLKTARGLGHVPASLLARADEVIE